MRTFVKILSPLVDSDRARQNLLLHWCGWPRKKLGNIRDPSVVAVRWFWKNA